MVSAATPSPQTLRDGGDVRRHTGEDARHAWIAQLIRNEGPGILRMLWRLLGSEQDVMDAYQDCFCKLAARKNRGDLISVKAYAYRTAANIAIEIIRVRSRRAAHLPAIAAERAEPPTDTGGEGEGEGNEKDRFALLRKAIARLPRHLRNVVVLRDLSRMSYGEVGRTLGIEPATARVYRRHAMVKLAGLLGEGDA